MFFAYVRWNVLHKRKSALALLEDDGSFAPGGEVALGRALALMAAERERLDTTTKRRVDELLRRQRPKVLRLLEPYWALLASDGAEPTPLEEAGSELFTKAVRAYGTDPAFRRDVIARLKGETTDAVWFDILLEATCSQPFLEDADAFHDVLEAYLALPEDGAVWRDAHIASLVVEWAHEAKRIDRAQALRPRFERQRDRAKEEEKEPWEDVLSDMEQAPT